MRSMWYVNIDDYADASRCPARIMLKMMGIKTREGVPRKKGVNPALIGKKGEQEVFESIDGVVKPEIGPVDIRVREYREKVISVKRGRQILEEFANFMEYLVSLFQSMILATQKVPRVSLPGIVEVIPRVKLYNVAYHYNGILDFLGVTASGDTVIIEVKNKSRIAYTDRVQVSLYLDSANRRYLAVNPFIIRDTLKMLLYTTAREFNARVPGELAIPVPGSPPGN